MDSRPDIWYQLREHQTPPPPEALSRLRESLSGLNGTLQRLQQQEHTPPAHLRESIANAIADQPRKRSLYVYGSIAASFLLLFAGYIVYRTLITNNPAIRQQDHAIVRRSPVNASGPTTSGSTVADTLKANDSTRATINTSIASLSASDSISVRLHRPMMVNLDGHHLHLVDNDPLFTFTSYHYPDIAKYMEQETEEIKISVDRYTNIVVSKQAAALLREIYKTRSNGKPTRRARKTKEKLEYWKKTDEKRFDGARSLNPADPIDLAEFIFK